MNERKLQKILEVARAEHSPAPLPGFDAGVMLAIRRERGPEAASVFDQLSLLFPRLAWASALVIAACVAGDFLSSTANMPGLTDGMARLSEQWLFTGEGF